MAPYFSIATPAYNAEATIGAAIESVLAQSIGDWELIVVDDGSTDRTADIVRGFADRDSRVRLVAQSNAGTSVARNTANSHCTGDFICRLDADDMLLPEYLESFRDFIAGHPGYDIYACNAWRVSVDGSRRLFHGGRRFAEVMSLTVEDMLQENQIFTAAVTPRSFYDLEGACRAGVVVDDYDLWLRAIARGARHIFLPRPLVLYRESPVQQTANPTRNHESQILVLRDIISEGLLAESQVRLAQHSIRLLEQNLRFRRTAVRLFGPRGAALAVGLARKASWLLRPYRWLRR